MTYDINNVLEVKYFIDRIYLKGKKSYKIVNRCIGLEKTTNQKLFIFFQIGASLVWYMDLNEKIAFTAQERYLIP